MKIKAIIDNKEVLIDTENITIKGVTLSSIINKFIKLEKDFENYKKSQELSNKKMKAAWDKIRGSNNG